MPLVKIVFEKCFYLQILENTVEITILFLDFY